jgi:putative endonuclease
VGPRDSEDRRRALRRGHDAEAWVAQLLEAQGWSVLARNWHARGGELDVVVERDGVLRFVEVRARDPRDDTGLESIGPTKQRRLRAAAEAWLLAHGEPEREVAFLVAIVALHADGWTVEWLDDAF